MRVSYLLGIPRTVMPGSPAPVLVDIHVLRMVQDYSSLAGLTALWTSA